MTRRAAGFVAGLMVGLGVGAALGYVTFVVLMCAPYAGCRAW